MRNIWKRKLNYRPVSQCGGLAQVVRDVGKEVEISVENSPHSKMRKMVIPFIGYTNNQYRIVKYDPDINIFKNMIFPTIHLTKENMVKISKKKGFFDILNLTWSCWFPINNKPCNKCPMCFTRIIK